MRTFIQAVPGTVRSCTGCHEYGPPQGSQSGKNSKRPQKLMPEPWGTGYMDYPSMIQPILNEKCVSCHGGEKGIAAGLDLSGAPTELFNISYVNLTSRREKQYIADLISGICCMNGTAYYSCKIFEPYSHGTGNAPAAELLMSDPIHKNLLTPEQRQLFFTWIDSNALYFGTWDYTKSGPYLRPWTDARSQIQQIMKENNCAECHADSKGNIARFENDWINLEQPEMSRVLRAPLKASETAPFGIGACRKHAFDQRYRRLGIMSAGRYEHAVKPLEAFPTQKWVPVAKAGDQSGDPVISWESSDNPVYQKMLTVIQKAKRQAYINPRIDMVEAAGKTDTIVAGRIRQIIPQPLPEKLPKASICLTKNNRVNLTWERNADTIGLVTEIHRSTTPHFTPSPETLIKETELFTYTDVLLPQGAYYYALVLVCDPAKTCGTCRVNPDIISEDGTGTAVQKSIEGRCPLSMFKPQKTEPIYLPVINTPVKTSAPTGTVFQRQDIDLSSDYVVLPGQDGYNAGEALTVSFDVWFDSTESMPIPVSFGKWRDSGWFLQSIGGKWRFHLSGTDCDSPQVIPLKQWIHLEACYQDCKMSLYQDGKLIASCSAPKPSELIPWTGDLFIGQYCAAEGKPFLFKGQIKNLKIVTQ